MGEMFAAIFVPIGSCVLLIFGGLLIFPSTRAAVAARLRRNTGPDPLDVDAISAQLMALRNEVYALRCEVDAVARTLPAGDASAGRIGQG